jgi:hypothetical protein
MWRTMIAVVHRDDDSEEATELWHGRSLIPADGPARLPRLRLELHVRKLGRPHGLEESGAAIDMIMTDKVGDVGSFGKKLEALEKNGVIGSKNREVLEAALDAGSAAAHRGYQPTTDDMGAVMDIVENLLQAAYHLNSLAERLKKATPARNA